LVAAGSCDTDKAQELIDQYKAAANWTTYLD